MLFKDSVRELKIWHEASKGELNNITEWNKTHRYDFIVDLGLICWMPPNLKEAVKLLKDGYLFKKHKGSSFMLWAEKFSNKRDVF